MPKEDEVFPELLVSNAYTQNFLIVYECKASLRIMKASIFRTSSRISTKVRRKTNRSSESGAMPWIGLFITQNVYLGATMSCRGGSDR